MMKCMLILLVLAWFVRENTGIEFKKLPVQFVTQKDIRGEPNEINYFSLATCGGCLYDTKIATVDLNLPDKAWRPDISDFLKCSVYDGYNHLIAVNKDASANWINTFTFIYSKAYGDLKFEVQNGNAPGLVYTINVKFTDNKTLEYTAPSCQPRYISTFQERTSWLQFQKAVRQTDLDGGTYALVSIFKSVNPGSVPTADIIAFELDYCFSIAELPGSVIVSVIATDEKSGFATYGCPGSIRPCTTQSANFTDLSGAAVNFVRIKLTQHADLGPIQVIVRGDGRNDGHNYFSLGASKFLKVI